MLKTSSEKYLLISHNIRNAFLKKNTLTVKLANLAIYPSIGISIPTNVNHVILVCISISRLGNAYIPQRTRNIRQILMPQRTFTLMEILSK